MTSHLDVVADDVAEELRTIARELEEGNADLSELEERPSLRAGRDAVEFEVTWT